MSGSPLRHAGYSDYILWPDRIEAACQDAMLTESYGKLGLTRPAPAGRARRTALVSLCGGVSRPYRDRSYEVRTDPLLESSSCAYVWG
jgi:hypothetical protein